MMRNKITVSLMAIFFTYTINSNVLAANSKYKATIKKVKNQVEYKYEENSWENVKVNQVIFPVTSIRTGPSSTTDIMFSDGTITRVGSKAFFTFLDKQNRAVKVQFGKLWFNVIKKSAGLKIYSHNAVASITGTEGFVEFSGNDSETYTVKPGDTLTAIALKFLGNKAGSTEIDNFIKKILSMNPDIIKNKNLVFEGNKIIINEQTSTKKSPDYFSLGLIEGSANVFKADKNGTQNGAAKNVKEGQLLVLQGDHFALKNLDSLFPKGMVAIKGSSFKMGGEDGESDEKPVHEVKVNTFLIGKNEVTQSEYKSVMGENPSHFSGDNLPVDTVSWWDAIKYCNKKSLAEKLPVAYNEHTGELLDANGNKTKDITDVAGYRLPTEAEWEFAAKGGYKSASYIFSGSNSVESVAWYGYQASGTTTHPVGSKTANEVGIFDMSGNVSEWVYDTYISDSYNEFKDNKVNPFVFKTKPGSYHVYRGGSWDALEKFQRVFTRSGYLPEFKDENIGFRIVKNITL